MSEPLINIVMNCYNGEHYLKKSLESILSQTFKNWELIFWDNCSTDRSAEIFHKYKDPRLHYFKSEKHTSQYEARKNAMLKTKRELVAFLDVDDWWDKNKLEKQVKLFDNKRIGFSCSNYWIVNQNKNFKKNIVFKKIPGGKVLSKLLKKNFIGMSTLMIRRKLYFELKYGFDSRFEIVGDYDLVLRLSIKNELGTLQEPLSYYRWHDNNLSHEIGKNARELRYMYNEMKKNDLFRSNKSFGYFKDFTFYLSSLSHKLEGNILKSFNEAINIENFFLKVRILLIIFLPLKFVKYIRS